MVELGKQTPYSLLILNNNSNSATYICSLCDSACRSAGVPRQDIWSLLSEYPVVQSQWKAPRSL